jgi:hypothetical protein
MIEPGYYKAKAVSASLGYTSNGNEQVAMTVDLLDIGKTMTWYGYFTGKTTDRTLESLMIAGWDGESLVSFEGLGTEEFVAVVEEDTYNGETKTRISWINRARSGGPKLNNPMSDVQLQDFAQRMKGRALALKSKVDKPKDVNPEDIPF